SFLGVNGAGKTTTLRMLCGILKPNSGGIWIAGYNLADEPLRAKRATGYIPDRPHVYAGLTGREYLYFVCELYGIKAAAADHRIDELLDEYWLAEWQNELIENYSHGMKQRIATCAALAIEPQVLIVDEPMVGLDPHGAKLLKESFRRYASKGMTIFLSTHSLNVAEEVSDRMAIIHHGKILSVGSMADLRALSGLHDRNLENIFLELTLNA
ncbi:MAG: ABC transporter ATP-binding protein, partial [Bdellovibrionales bacterium]|nr:ABC transporter ATP-binding protein [Bdellovibrionales bacterium]